MKLTVQLGILAAWNIALSFCFQWYVLTRLGAGAETDAFFAAVAVPQLVLTVVSGSLMHVLVPILSGETGPRLCHDSWAFLILVSGLFTSLSIALLISSAWWVPLLVPGFGEATQELTITLARIQLLGIVFTGINSVQLAVSHVRGSFIWAEFGQLFSSAASLLLVAFTLPEFGVIAAAWATVLRFSLLTIILLPIMGLPVAVNLKAPVIKEAWARIRPLLLGTAYYKTDALFERYLLSSASSGTLSLYYFAQQLYNAANQVLNKAIVAPLVPILSQAYKQHDKIAFRKYYKSKLLLTLSLTFSGVLILAVAGKYILELLVGYGDFSAEDISLLWLILIWLCGMAVGGGVGQVASGVFYATGDTRTPVVMSIITYTIYIPCKVYVFWNWGVEGLAAVTSAYYFINLSLLIFLFERSPFGSKG